MLATEDFEQFVKEVGETFEVFCTWTSCHTEGGNKDVLDKVYADPKLKPTLHVLDAAVQHSWILGVARLLDPEKSAGKENISIEYVLRKLDNTDLLTRFTQFKTTHADFIDTYKEVRHKRLSHNAKLYKPTLLKAGVEEFFEFLEELINEISKQIVISQKFSVKEVTEKTNESVTNFIGILKEYTN